MNTTKFKKLLFPVTAVILTVALIFSVIFLASALRRQDAGSQSPSSFGQNFTGDNPAFQGGDSGSSRQNSNDLGSKSGTASNSVQPSASAMPSKPSAGEPAAPPDDAGDSFVKPVSKNLITEAYASFLYFWEQTQTADGSPGYGLTRDRWPGSENMASVAATGYALTAYPIGVEYKWITRQQGEERALKTLDALMRMDTVSGFYYHFINMTTGKPMRNTEVSVIDTALLLNGVLTAGEYFGGDIKNKADEIYRRVDWNFYIDKGKSQYYMSYTPGKGFSGHWDNYAEQLMMYVLGAGSPTHPMDKKVYDGFNRMKGSYGGQPDFIYSWFGSIFVYQYSHAWIDFRNKKDDRGVNWFDNSVYASRAAHKFAVDNKKDYKSFSETSWGLSACDTPTGYSGLLGSPPARGNEVADVIPPAGAIGSVVFTPAESLGALDYYMTVPNLLGKYGLKDAFSLSKNWVANDYVGIDKGITLLMLINYDSEFVWKTCMKNQYVKNGLTRLGIK